MTTMNFDLVLFGPAVVALALYLAWRYTRSRKVGSSTSQESYRASKVVQEESTSSNDAYYNIKALRDFDWSATEPVKIRPFKPKFHLTMGVENCSLSELLEMDNTYLDRIGLRKEVLDAHPVETYQCNEPCASAVIELYNWLFSVYLPYRFPDMFELRCSSDDMDKDTGQANTEKRQQPTHLYNKVNHTSICASTSSPREALYTISAQIDTDFLILLPSSTDSSGAPIYHLEAFTCCFPAGFSLLQKLSLPLAGIHKPVPGYAAKLEKSMDRFFAKLECGKAVKRHNWSVTTNDQLFTLGGNHLYADGKNVKDPENDGSRQAASGSGKKAVNAKTLDVHAEDIYAMIEAQKKDVNVQDCRLRCERQTLHRLPQSKALVFAFKTYLYSLDEIKMEASGEALAEAIDGLRKGSVPETEFYKRGVVWGEKVKEYLRS